MGPTYMTWSPMASSTGLWRSKTARSPPTHSASFRVRAPCGPPLTGASSRCRPRAVKRSCRRRISDGELVLRSNHAAPDRMPASSPASARATLSTSRGPGSDVKTTSAPSAASRGVSAHLAPAARCGAAASRRRSWTVSSWPPARALRAMLLPMSPRPMKPIFMAPPALFRRDDLVPQLAVLLLVRRPDLLLGHLPERGHVGGVDLHAARLEDLLGLGEVVHALGGLADLFLRLPADLHEELLLLGREAVPDVQVHDEQGGPVVVERHGDVLRDLVHLQRVDVVDRQIG